MNMLAKKLMKWPKKNIHIFSVVNLFASKTGLKICALNSCRVTGLVLSKKSPEELQWLNFQCITGTIQVGKEMKGKKH